ncbi:658dc49a-26de-48e0-b497-a0ee77020c5a [Thermothielavioides terrestris]|uniref:658dc49a-26de-48e0-b497-a0ee77020c5a n=1 Tax=Thermothielavioides terrestris TaxID=2587410 RepID=A0A446B9L6_9PEZI|nr:658dc49a-26de-48e0-b497-a0ee77020c5a [Thermothielavioides terrestris]
MGKKRRADAIGRDSHAAKKLRPHHHPTTTAPPKPTRQQHEHYRAANRKKQSILRDLLPKAGMIYPFAKTLMKRPRSDVAVLSAIKNALDTPTLSTALLDDILAAIFHEATDLLQLLQQQKKTYHHHHYDDGLNPLAFTALLRARPALHEPWTRRSADLFARLFLTLRAARLAWRARPRPPFDVGRHCRLARAVDAFVAVEGVLDWAGPGLAEWLVRGGLDEGWYGVGGI